MDVLHTHLIDPAAADVREQLDRLSAWVAEQLEGGHDEAAWAVTLAAEDLAGRVTAREPRPTNPVIGRRFAAAHRRLLADGAGLSWVRSVTAA